MKTEDIQIFIGLDVGKTDHWACALIQDGTKIWNKTLPNDEAKLTAVYQKLLAQGQVLVVVDQPATIGALAVAVAQNLGIPVAYLPGLSMRRIADMYPGTAKTDEKDPFIIADAARTMPHTLRSIQVSDEDEATLGMLTGFDLDLARQITQTSNRIRGLFTQIHPPLERILDPWLEHDAVLEILATWPTPAQLKHAGKARIDAKLKKYGGRRHTAWAVAIMDALDEQTVVVVGTDAAGLVIPHLARQLISLHAQRVDVATHLHLETMVEAHPLYPVLTSIPGVAVRTAAIIIAETSGKTFPSAAALSSYAGLAPTTRQSGTSIKSERVSHSGNKRLKRALFLSAFASIRFDPTSRDYYDRKQAQGKRHNQALIALAHRRLTVLFAMIRDASLYDVPELKIAWHRT
ncbi:IS110 family transposase [Glutamicibacter mysorens]|uniref:IS110 family transposase n=1 Tax=Glutamicibacter mysorens TaxID=257984 RepID=UPI0020C6F644|nr:IS110 family transposase [Glutamicibacter mysorens]UTM48199.1 IS110 family transposase [Glutamicibacter mysorens]